LGLTFIHRRRSTNYQWDKGLEKVRSFLCKSSENLAASFSGPSVFLRPLLSYAAELSAPWQHWMELFIPHTVVL
jgi:hypothetical protein